MDPRDFETLGLKPEASLDDVKKKYDLLMRRSIHDESVEIDDITKAYDRIINENKVEYFDPDADLLKVRGINKKKVRNFVFQRKIMLGIIIWAVICLLLFLYIIIFEPGNISLMPDMVPF